MATVREKDVERILDELAERINELAKELTIDNYDVIQEPAFTSRLAQEITSEIRRHPINAGGATIEVHSVDVPSLSSPMEKDIGADLYISLVRHDIYPPVSKGIIVQSKWDKTVTDRRLPGQMGQMIDRTGDSYVWAYGPESIACAKVVKTIHGPELLEVSSIGDLVADGLRCTVGDPGIGRDLSLPRGQAMRHKLRELHANTALSFTLTNRPRAKS